MKRRDIDKGGKKMNEGNSPEMGKMMKAVSIKISVMMALVMSICLSIVGNLTAKRPPGTPLIAIVISILVSIALSFVISLIIGLVIPMGKLLAALDRKLGLQPGKIGTRLFDALISNIIYTPFMTFAMTIFAYITSVKKSGAPISYPMMYLRALAISFVVGYVLIFIFQPLFMKMFMPKRPPEGENGPA